MKDTIMISVKVEKVNFDSSNGFKYDVQRQGIA